MNPLLRPAAALCLALSLGSIPGLSHADAADDRGLEIAQQMDRADSGWGDQLADMQMILRNRHGAESRRQIRTRNKEIDGDGDLSMSIFDAPADVKGTAFLSHTHALKPDDQWLYLPALKRVKRISSRNKSGPFMGSEFAYEDLSSQEIEKYSYRYLGEQPLPDSSEQPAPTTWLIERRPNYKHSGYTRQRVWVDPNILRPLRIEFYDRKNTLLKTLTFHDYKPYLDGKIYRPQRLEMTNHQTGKSTTLSWANYRFGTGLSKRDFDRNALKRVR